MLIRPLAILCRHKHFQLHLLLISHAATISSIFYYQSLKHYHAEFGFTTQALPQCYHHPSITPCFRLIPSFFRHQLRAEPSRAAPWSLQASRCTGPGRSAAELALAAPLPPPAAARHPRLPWRVPSIKAVSIWSFKMNVKSIYEVLKWFSIYIYIYDMCELCCVDMKSCMSMLIYI